MLKIEPLAPEHDRATCDCGEQALNEYLRHTARQHADKGIAKTFVLIDDQAPHTILGFVTLAVCEVSTLGLPEKLARRLPPVVPAARLGRLAVSQTHQRQGHGELLLTSAMRRALQVSTSVGIIALFVDAKDDRARSFYLRYGFLELQDDPLKLYLPIASVAQAFS